MRALVSALLAVLALAALCTVSATEDLGPIIQIDPATVEQNQKDLERLFGTNNKKSNDVIIDPSIAYGSYASYGQFPFIASLQRNVTQNGITVASYSACGGTLIWPNMILTAAHCVFDQYNNPLPPNFALIGGTIVPTINNLTAQTNAPEAFSFTGYKPHPQYSRTNYAVANDIAILVLNGVSKLPYVNLSRTAPGPGSVLTAIGWGAREDGKSSSALMYGNMQVAAPNQLLPCNNQVGSMCMIEYAVNTINGTKYQGTCEGDSGGPQIIPNTNTQATLTSYGPDGCGVGNWEVDTSVAYYYDSFIAPMIAQYGIPNPNQPSPSPPPSPVPVSSPPPSPVLPSPSPPVASPPPPSPSPIPDYSPEPIPSPLPPVCIKWRSSTKAKSRFVGGSLYRKTYSGTSSACATLCVKNAKNCASYNYARLTGYCYMLKTQRTSMARVNDGKYDSGYLVCSQFQ